MRILMKLRTLPPLLLVALLLAGCGSSGGSGAKLGAGDIAAVGPEHVTLTQYDQALNEERASMKAAGTAFPKAGTTAYQQLQTTIIDASTSGYQSLIGARQTDLREIRRDRWLKS